MPLLSTRIFPNFESAIETVDGVGADAVTGLVVGGAAATVVVGASVADVAGLAVLALLEHAASAIAARAATATNRSLDEGIEGPLSIGFPSHYGPDRRSVHRRVARAGS
jgi:sugar (pentulose or hexulose) kinase